MQAETYAPFVEWDCQTLIPLAERDVLCTVISKNGD